MDSPSIPLAIPSSGFPQDSKSLVPSLLLLLFRHIHPQPPPHVITIFQCVRPFERHRLSRAAANGIARRLFALLGSGPVKDSCARSRTCWHNGAGNNNNGGGGAERRIQRGGSQVSSRQPIPSRHKPPCFTEVASSAIITVITH